MFFFCWFQSLLDDDSSDDVETGPPAGGRLGRVPFGARLARLQRRAVAVPAAETHRRPRARLLAGAIPFQTSGRADDVAEEHGP